jgi:hypothetical protein
MEKARERQAIINKKKRSLLETKRISKFSVDKSVKKKPRLEKPLLK